MLFDTVQGKALFRQQLPAGAFLPVLSVSFPSEPQAKAGSVMGCGISQARALWYCLWQPLPAL